MTAAIAWSGVAGLVVGFVLGACFTAWCVGGNPWGDDHSGEGP